MASLEKDDFINKKDDFSQLTLSDIRKLPIPKIDKTTQKPLIDIADQIIQHKK